MKPKKKLKEGSRAEERMETKKQEAAEVKAGKGDRKGRK